MSEADDQVTPPVHILFVLIIKPLILLVISLKNVNVILCVERVMG